MPRMRPSWYRLTMEADRLAEIRARLSTIADPVALLEGIFAFAPVGFQIYDATGHCVLTNPAFRELFGAEHHRPTTF